MLRKSIAQAVVRHQERAIIPLRMDGRQTAFDVSGHHRQYSVMKVRQAHGRPEIPMTKGVNLPVIRLRLIDLL